MGERFNNPGENTEPGKFVAGKYIQKMYATDHSGQDEQNSDFQLFFTPIT